MYSEPAIDVLTAEPIQSGITVAHRRFGTEYRANASQWPTRRFPACHPEHIHGCDNQRNGEPEKCAYTCICVCTCGDVWKQYSAGRAGELGAVACPESACFGGGDE